MKENGDAVRAMRLFGSTYYGEGNGIGKVEKMLGEIVGRFEREVGELGRVVVSEEGGREEEVGMRVGRCWRVLEEYRKVGRIDEIVGVGA